MKKMEVVLVHRWPGYFDGTLFERTMRVDSEDNIRIGRFRVKLRDLTSAKMPALFDASSSIYLFYGHVVFRLCCKKYFTTANLLKHARVGRSCPCGWEQPAFHLRIGHSKSSTINANFGKSEEVYSYQLSGEKYSVTTRAFLYGRLYKPYEAWAADRGDPGDNSSIFYAVPA